MTNKNLREEIESLIDNITIDMYCDENHNLSDELERNEHEIAETKEILRNAIPRLIDFFMARAVAFYEDDKHDITATELLEKLESLQKEAKGE